MPRIVAVISSLGQHIRTLIEDPERYRPACCPACGLKGLWAHGTYERKLYCTLGRFELIEVLRFICGKKGGCRATCSSLPSCAPPRRWYQWSVQQAMLVMCLSGTSLRHCAETLGCLWGPARSTVRRWSRWLEHRHDQFAFHLLTAHPEWGRSSTWQAFWQHAFGCESLAELMASLDRRGVIVP